MTEGSRGPDRRFSILDGVIASRSTPPSDIDRTSGPGAGPRRARLSDYFLAVHVRVLGLPSWSRSRARSCAVFLGRPRPRGRQLLRPHGARRPAATTATSRTAPSRPRARSSFCSRSAVLRAAPLRALRPGLGFPPPPARRGLARWRPALRGCAPQGRPAPAPKGVRSDPAEDRALRKRRNPTAPLPRRGAVVWFCDDLPAATREEHDHNGRFRRILGRHREGAHAIEDGAMGHVSGDRRGAGARRQGYNRGWVSPAQSSRRNSIGRWSVPRRSGATPRRARSAFGRRSPESCAGWTRAHWPSFPRSRCPVDPLRPRQSRGNHGVDS